MGNYSSASAAENSTMVEPNDYKERLSAAMRHGNVQPKALIAHLGVTYQAVKKVTEGIAKFSAENNSKAARLCGVNSDWLATGEGGMLDGQDHFGRKGSHAGQGNPAKRVMLPLISGGTMRYIDRANDDPEVLGLPTAEALLCEHTPTSKLYVSPAGIAGTRIRAGDMLEFGPADRALTDDDVVALRDPDGLVVVRKHDPTYEKTHRLEVVALMVQFQGRSAV